LESILIFSLGLIIGWLVFFFRERSRSSSVREQEVSLLDTARRESEALLRETRVAAHEEALRLRESTESSLAERRKELEQLESRLALRESLVAEQSERLAGHEKSLLKQREELQNQVLGLKEKQKEVEEFIGLRRQKLEEISQMNPSEARTLFLKEIEQEALRDAGAISRQILDNAKTKTEEQARRIISLAIQRYAGAHTFETTTATVALQGEDIKGRIIGREGRNIRAFEAATGVTVLIDDTPNAVVLSGFDPVRREIAREAMHRLILDGRIHPTRIEEVVAKVSQEIEETVIKAGEEALYRLGLPPPHAEVTRVLGKLHFRYSFSQNILEHSIEVAHLAGLLAAELGGDILVAKRAGLLHDLGKAIDTQMEGSHALIGAEFIKRHGEPEEVVDGVASHHDEVPHKTIYGILVSAADAISASRPGARSERMTTYIKRLEDLEKIGLSFPGVEKCYAVQAGRDLRVIVQPHLVSDDEAMLLARNMARRIEEELQYPGQIRVTVVRESRCVEIAK
jgi:ribonucrease Y